MQYGQNKSSLKTVRYLQKKHHYNADAVKRHRKSFPSTVVLLSQLFYSGVTVQLKSGNTINDLGKSEEVLKNYK